MRRMLDAQFDISRQRQQAKQQKEQRERPFQALEFAPGGIGIGKIAPLHGQPVQANAAMQFDHEQQRQIQRPHHAAPDPVGRFIRADQLRVGHHQIEVHRGKEKHAEAGDDLDEPDSKGE